MSSTMVTPSAASAAMTSAAPALKSGAEMLAPVYLSTPSMMAVLPSTLITKGDVTVKNVIPKHLESITAKLLEIGCEVEETDDCIRVVASKPLQHTQVKTLPYPGFPTDMQPQITVALALSKGTSIVTESIFEN